MKRFVTNFTAHQVGIYRKAVRVYNQFDSKKVFTIELEARDCRGRVMESDLSLHVDTKSDTYDLSEFWVLFNMIRDKHRDVYDGIKATSTFYSL